MAAASVPDPILNEAARKQIVDEVGRQSAPNCFEAFSQRHERGATLVTLIESSLCLVVTLSHPYLFYYTCNGV
jgi:hypothetical protein